MSEPVISSVCHEIECELSSVIQRDWSWWVILAGAERVCLAAATEGVEWRVGGVL